MIPIIQKLQRSDEVELLLESGPGTVHELRRERDDSPHASLRDVLAKQLSGLKCHPLEPTLDIGWTILEKEVSEAEAVVVYEGGPGASYTEGERLAMKCAAYTGIPVYAATHDGYAPILEEVPKGELLLF